MTQQPDQNQGGHDQQGQSSQGQQGQDQQGQPPQQHQQYSQQPQAQQQGYGQQQPQQGYAQGGQQYAQQQQYAQHQQHYAQQGSAPSAASAQGAGYAGQQGYQQGYAQPQAPQGPKEKNFFAALFDFSFQKPTTEKYAKFFFLMVVITIAFHWLITTVFAFVDGAQNTSYDPWPGLISLVFGPLVVLVAIILVRVFFENAIGNIRTAEKLEKKKD